MTHTLLHLSPMTVFFSVTALLACAVNVAAVQIPVGNTQHELAAAESAIPDTAPQPNAGTVSERQIKRVGGPARPEINITYPYLNRGDIDRDISQWATNIADAFDAGLSGDTDAPDEREQRRPHELWGTYAISRPSHDALSITFEIWTYTGGTHGNLDIMTLNYSLITGQRLGLVDIFEDVDEALKLMSLWSYKELSQRFAGGRIEQMIRYGTTPETENFSSLTLTPSGIRIRFQPYQVAPWAAGAQDVDMPLEEMAGAKPFLRLWAR